MRNLILGAALLLATLQTAAGQTATDNSRLPSAEWFDLLYTPRIYPDESHSHELCLGINSNAFIRNAEYFLPYTKGYTAFGFFLDPTLTYYANDKAAVTAGVHLMGIAGSDGLRDVQPIFRIDYRPEPWVTIVGGSLYGNLNHQLYEPMYDFDRYFYANDEMGLQILTSTRHWEGDLWCNWETFIEPGDDFQEQFTFGWSNRLHAIKNPCCYPVGTTPNPHTVELSFPVHILATHRGGQFTSLQDTCIETLANAMVGITTSINTPDRLVRKTTFDLALFGFKNNSNKEHIHTHYKDGWGIYPNLTLQNMGWKVQAGYWRAERFVGARGSYLFQSRSYFDPTFKRAERNMATAKLFYQYGCQGIGIGLEGQAYYDLDEASTDFSFGIYLRFCDRFKLMKIKGL